MWALRPAHKGWDYRSETGGFQHWGPLSSARGRGRAGILRTGTPLLPRFWGQRKSADAQEPAQEGQGLSGPCVLRKHPQLGRRHRPYPLPSE